MQYKVMYVTSFNDKLYNVTGRKMLHSFLNTKTEGDMLITHEKLDPKVIVKADNFTEYDLAEDQWLKDWTYNNRDIVAEKYGGEWKIDYGNKGPGNDEGFRRQAARWFRKIVSLREAVRIHDHDAIVFVDSDTIFKRQLRAERIYKFLNGYALFHHTGEFRAKHDKGIESGFIGFNMNEGGREYLQRVFDCFESGDFRRYKRWDDSYVFHHVLTESTFLHNDLVGHHIVKIGGRVVEHGPFRKDIDHAKGSHWRTHKVL